MTIQGNNPRQPVQETHLTPSSQEGSAPFQLQLPNGKLLQEAASAADTVLRLPLSIHLVQQCITLSRCQQGSNSLGQHPIHETTGSSPRCEQADKKHPVNPCLLCRHLLGT